MIIIIFFHQDRLQLRVITRGGAVVLFLLFQFFLCMGGKVNYTSRRKKNNRSPSADPDRSFCTHAPDFKASDEEFIFFHFTCPTNNSDTPKLIDLIFSAFARDLWAIPKCPVSGKKKTNQGCVNPDYVEHRPETLPRDSPGVNWMGDSDVTMKLAHSELFMELGSVRQYPFKPREKSFHTSEYWEATYAC